jgi:hypothetical protein
MDPLGGLVVVAGVAGITRVLGAHAEQIVEAIEQHFNKEQVDLSRVVLVEHPKHTSEAAQGMDLGS